MGSSPTFGIVAESPPGRRFLLRSAVAAASAEPAAAAYDRVVAYDEELAGRIRELMADERGLTEKKMFGGLAFLVNGNMSVAASGQGGLLVRVDPDESEALVRKPGVEMMEMRGRTMAGWLRVESSALRTKKQLLPWVERGVGYARSLPPKR